MRKNRFIASIHGIGGAAIFILSCQLGFGQSADPAPSLVNANQVQTDQEPSATTNDLRAIREVRLAENGRAWQINSVLLGYQPSAEDLQAIQKVGFRRVVNLMSVQEGRSDDAAICGQLGLEHQRIPVSGPEALNRDVINQVRITLLESGRRPVFLHGDSKDLVAAVWVVYRSLDQGVELEKAIEEARTMGLANSEYEQKVRDYVRQMQYANTSINQEYDFVPLTLPGSS